MACAWYHETILSPAVAYSHDAVYVPLQKVFGRDVAYVTAAVVEALIYLLLLDLLVWPIAKGYLQVKWQKEIEEANREYHGKRQAELRDRGF
jgi:hypothetical protein